MKIIAIFVSLLMSCTMTSAAVLNACGGDNNWPPMSYVTGQTQLVKGISAEILRNVFRTKLILRFSLGRVAFIRRNRNLALIS